MNGRHTHRATLLLTVLLLVACGADGAARNDAPSGPDEAAQTVARTPAELGAAIGALYVEAIESVAEEVSERPDPALLRPRLEELKEACVTDLVELGRAREALAAADRATVDGAVRLAVGRIPSATFSAYAEGQNHYLAIDRELADLIASFNVITQYANFDLLKKQAPAEAERLGIR